MWSEMTKLHKNFTCKNLHLTVRLFNFYTPKSCQWIHLFLFTLWHTYNKQHILHTALLYYALFKSMILTYLLTVRCAIGLPYAVALSCVRSWDCRSQSAVRPLTSQSAAPVHLGHRCLSAASPTLDHVPPPSSPPHPRHGMACERRR